MALSPKESAKFIAAETKNITIKEEGIQKLGDVLVEELLSERLSFKNFSQCDVHPKKDDPNALDWLLVVDTLNFCFWSPENEVGWCVEKYTGYFALCAAINRAVKEKVDILNPKFYSTITEEQLGKILRSDTDVKIPLLSERVKCLHEVGASLLENFEGKFENMIKKADKSADEAEYKGKTVSIYKRAQILVGDIWACFQGEGLGYFKDIDEITMFADYRVPQTLLYYKVFEYSDELNEKLKQNVILKNGDEAEVEIRGCSIHAVELLKEYAAKKIKDGKVNSILIDHFLWDFRRKHAEEILKMGLPFHKTICIYY